MGTIGGACPLVPERDVLSETQTTTTTTHHSQELDKKKAKNAHHWKQTPKVNVRKNRTICTTFTAAVSTQRTNHPTPHD